MESLMATILLRLAWLDSLEGDAGLDDLHCQLRDPEISLRRRPGLAVVDANRPRHPMLAEEADERIPDVDRDRVPDRGASPAAEQVAAERVCDGERIATCAVAETEPAFEVHRPDRIRLVRVLEGLRLTALVARPHARSDQSTPLQELADRARSGHVPSGLMCPEPGDELLGSPGRVRVAELDETLAHSG